MTWIMRITLLSLAVVTGFNLREGWAQMSADPQATKYWQYFLDHAPADVDSAKLPASAQDVIIAKVRIVGGPSALGGRDQSGQPPPPPKDPFFARVKIIAVLSGKAVTEGQYDLYYGASTRGGSYKNPVTPGQKARDYFIVSYVENDKRRRLLAFPESREEYEKWQKEFYENERIKGRPGARDR